MIIEIKGVGFVNKGAELMLHAVLQKIGCALPEVSFVMAPSSSGRDYAKRARLGLYQKIWYSKYGVQWGRLARVMPRTIRSRYGLITDEEVDVVLDASGFLYSDQWGEVPAVTMASCVRIWKKRGVKVVLLPQAMGPFTSQTIRRAVAFVVENADLVFPRDEVSYKYVVDLVGERKHVLQSPDFTNLVTGTVPADAERLRRHFCLVPNYRMVEKTSDGQSDRYPSFCASCIRCLIECGHTPFVLVHEGERDLRLAERIVHESGHEIEIVQEPDPLRTKGVLGLCSGVIGSRFHGLVSALSQGVPVLATGWSHKYEMLLREYGVPDNCLPVTIESDALCKQIKSITEEDSRREMAARILVAGAAYKKQTETMWERVIAVLERRRVHG